ncbi:MAG: hypothetical protein J6N72_04065, partial [Psychrobacter sp.]|nr:hypothetical protein [Psychrobacter sp.]
MSAAEENYLLDAWHTVRTENKAGDTQTVNMTGMIIAQVLYQILYYTELEYHTIYKKNRAN